MFRRKKKKKERKRKTCQCFKIECESSKLDGRRRAVVEELELPTSSLHDVFQITLCVVCGLTIYVKALKAMP
jgi:hypothetical protein